MDRKLRKALEDKDKNLIPLTDQEKEYIIYRYIKHNLIALIRVLFPLGIIAGITYGLFVFYQELPHLLFLFIGIGLLANFPFALFLFIFSLSFAKPPRLEGALEIRDTYKYSYSDGSAEMLGFITQHINKTSIVFSKSWLNKTFLNSDKEYLWKVYSFEQFDFFNEKFSNNFYLLLGLDGKSAFDTEMANLRKIKRTLHIFISALSGILFFIMTLYMIFGEKSLLMSWRFFVQSGGKTHTYQSVPDFQAARPPRWQSVHIKKCFLLGNMIFDIEDYSIKEMEQDIVFLLQARFEAFFIIQNKHLSELSPKELEKIAVLNNLKSFKELQEIYSTRDSALLDTKKETILNKLYKQEAAYLTPLVQDKYNTLDSSLQLNIKSFYELPDFTAEDIKARKTVKVFKEKNAILTRRQEVKGVIINARETYRIDTGKSYNPEQLLKVTVSYFIVLLIFLLSLIMYKKGVFPGIMYYSNNMQKLFSKLLSFIPFTKRGSDLIFKNMRIFIIFCNNEYFLYSIEGPESKLHQELVHFIMCKQQERGSVKISMNDDRKFCLQKDDVLIDAPLLSYQLTVLLRTLVAQGKMKKIRLSNEMCIEKKLWGWKLSGGAGKEEKVHPLFADFVSTNWADTRVGYDVELKTFYLMDNKGCVIKDETLSRQLTTFYYYKGIENTLGL